MVALAKSDTMKQEFSQYGYICPYFEQQHNIRNPKVVSKEPHIQPDGKFEIWHDEKPQVAYQRIFGQALEEYNNKQKRTDRKIQDYYRHICNDKKKHPVYEMIVAIGNRNNTVDDETGYSVLCAFPLQQVMSMV